MFIINLLLVHSLSFYSLRQHTMNLLMPRTLFSKMANTRTNSAAAVLVVPAANFSRTNRLGASEADKGTVQEVPKTVPVPSPKEMASRPAEFDQLTHTGQAWDVADWRRSRYEYTPKQVNPNIAAHLIAELPPVPSEERTVRCDGGHPELGHPRVYINLDKPGTHACGYCGQRFYNVHTTKAEQLGIQHIQV